MGKLHHTLAVEKGVKGKAESALTKAYHTIQKPELFNGLQRKYTPVEENGAPQPSQNKVIQQSVNDIIKEVRTALTELFNVVATKDTGNMKAKANVVVGGDILLAGVPVATLIFMEKKLTDLTTFVSKLPTLDPSEVWTYDKDNSVYKTEATKTVSYRKDKKVVTLAPATDKHAAQVNLIDTDVQAGYWEQSKQAQAIPVSQQKELLGRVEELSKAVKLAREEANSTEIEQVSVGEKFFQYLFG